jgi:hypothetical protein
MADPGAVVAKQAQNAVLQKAFDNPKLKTASLVEEFVAKTDDPSFRTRTVTVKTMQRMVQMRKAKALMKPAAPRSFDDLEFLPDEFTVCHKYTLKNNKGCPDFNQIFNEIYVIKYLATDQVVLVAGHLAGRSLSAFQQALWRSGRPTWSWRRTRI